MRLALFTLLLLLVASTASADQVQVEVHCTVEYSQVKDGPLLAAQPGDEVVAYFVVDSENYIDSTSYGVRNYPIDVSSFELHVGSLDVINLVIPQPEDATIYFGLRESDPVSDGFFLAAIPDTPWIFPYIDVPGAALEPYFVFRYDVSYLGETLGSRDIMDAIGTYNRDTMESYGCGVDDGWATVLGLIYQYTVITTEVVPTPVQSWGAVKSLYR